MRAIPQPNYSLLSAANIALVLESPGLIGGTNRYGIVDGEGDLTTWRGIRPGVAGRNFTGMGTGFVRRETANGIAVVGVSERAFLRSADAASTYDFMSHNAIFANLKWTVTMLMRIGFGTQPGDLAPFFGNNGISQSNKGIVVYMDDRNANNLTLGHALTRASAGSPISTSFDAAQVTPNEWAIHRFTFDGALAAASRFKAYKNKVQVTTTVTSSSTATVTTPSFALELFAGGNGLNGIGSYQVSHIVIQNNVDATAADLFEDSLLPYLNALNANPNNQFHPYSVRKDDGTKYYLSTKICQNPTSPSTVVKLYAIANQHAIVSGDIQTLYVAKSTDYGRTFAAESVYYTTGSASVTGGDWGGGYDSLGRLWVFMETRDTTTVNNIPFGAKIIYSDDDGTTPIVVDILSIIPADGLTSWAMRGQLIETSTGRLIFQFYKWESGTTATSANYALYTDDRSTWGIKTIRAVGSPYRNEAGAFLVGDGVTEKIVIYLRDDDTDAWRIYSSTDDGDTYTDDGAEDLGITIANAGPITFEKFLINGVAVVGGYFSDRTTAPYIFLAIYGRGGPLFTDPHAFDEDTRIIVVNAAGYHYMSVCHPDNSLFALGLSGREPNPLTNTESDIVTFFMPTWQEDLIKQQLGL